MIDPEIQARIDREREERKANFGLPSSVEEMLENPDWKRFISNEAVNVLKRKGGTVEQLRGLGASEEQIRMPFSPEIAGKTPFTELTEEQLISGGYTHPRYRENPPSYGAPYWIDKEGNKVYKQPKYTLSDAQEDETNSQILPTETELEDTKEQLRQRANHLEHRLNKAQTEPIIEMDEGSAVTTAWYNDFLNSAIAKAGDVGKSVLAIFEGIANAEGIPDIVALQDPELASMMADDDMYAMGNFFRVDETELTPEEREQLYLDLQEEISIPTKSFDEADELIHLYGSIEDDDLRYAIAERLIYDFGCSSKDFTNADLLINQEIADIWVPDEPEYTYDSFIPQEGQLYPEDITEDKTLEEVYTGQPKGSWNSYQEFVQGVQEEVYANDRRKKIFDLMQKDPTFAFAMTHSGQAVANEIARMERELAREQRQIDIGNIPQRHYNRAIVDRFNKKYGTTYKDWSALNKAIFSKALSSSQVMWVREKYNMTQGWSPAEAAKDTAKIDKAEAALRAASQGNGYIAVDHPTLGLLTGAIDPTTRALINESPIVQQNQHQVAAAWQAFQDSKKSQLVEEGMDPRASLHVPFEVMLDAVANGDTTVLENTMWAEFVGQRYATLYARGGAKSADPNVKAQFNKALNLIGSVADRVTPETLGAFALLGGIRNEGRKMGRSDLVYDLFTSSGYSKEGGLVIIKATEELLSQAGPDGLEAMDPNEVSMLIQSSTARTARIFAAAALAAQGTTAEIKDMLGTDNVNLINSISSRDIIKLSADDLSSLTDGDTLDEAEQRNIYQSSLDDLILLLDHAHMLPEGTETYAAIGEEMWNAMKETFTPYLDKQLTEDWDDMTKVVYGLKAMLATPEAKEAFRASMYTTLLTEGATFRDTVEYFSMFLQNKNMTLIPGTKGKNGAYEPEYVALSPDYSYNQWRSPKDDTPSGVHNAKIWNSLLFTGSQKTITQVAWKAILRNFSKLPGKTGLGNLTEKDIRPAFEKAMKQVRSINADPKQQDVGLIELHYLMAKELVADGYKARGIDIFEAFGARGATRLHGLSFSMVPTRNAVTGNVAGYRGSPYLHVTASKKEQATDPGIFTEGTSRDKVQDKYVNRWITMADEDFVINSAESLAKRFQRPDEPDYMGIGMGGIAIPKVEPYGGYE